MRMYKLTDGSGESVDLDDPKTYSRMPDDIREVDNLMMREIGQAHCYMNYFHPDSYPDGDNQRKRVEAMIYNFTTERHNNWKNVMWFKEKVFLFQDETENMC